MESSFILQQVFLSDDVVVDMEYDHVPLCCNDV